MISEMASKKKQYQESNLLSNTLTQAMKKATQREMHVCCKSDVKTQKIAHYT